jgi:hypothetical protein
MLVELRDIWAGDSFPLSSPDEFGTTHADSESIREETRVVDEFVSVEASVSGRIGEFSNLRLHRLY